MKITKKLCQTKRLPSRHFGRKIPFTSCPDCLLPAFSSKLFLLIPTSLIRGDAPHARPSEASPAAAMKFGHRFQQVIEQTHPRVSDQVRVLGDLVATVFGGVGKETKPVRPRGGRHRPHRRPGRRWSLQPCPSRDGVRHGHRIDTRVGKHFNTCRCPIHQLTVPHPPPSSSVAVRLFPIIHRVASHFFGEHKSSCATKP